MSDHEGFLTRWSRRKLEAGEDESQVEAAAEPSAASDTVPPTPTLTQPSSQESDAPPSEFDLASLPPIESIDATTDIRAFLARGVPAALTRAALRRAWLADPAIRDFIGLSENSWDFNAPGGVPGFGPIEPELDVARLAREMLGDGGSGEQTLAQSDTPSAVRTEELAPKGSEMRDSASGPPKSIADRQSEQVAVAGETSARDSEEIAAVQNQSTAEEGGEEPVQRSHGGALPQ
jgi:hypothetical protein